MYFEISFKAKWFGLHLNYQMSDHDSFTTILITKKKTEVFGVLWWLSSGLLAIDLIRRIMNWRIIQTEQDNIFKRSADHEELAGELYPIWSRLIISMHNEYFFTLQFQD